MDDITPLYESAVREAVTAFGRGECFVERYLDKPRHVETQCIADHYGTVQIISTRDCSLQRRHQKLVEEAPAPFLSDEQRTRLYESSRAILMEAGYVGAATCEFLVGRDGTISFLEVNTRLQVEHPVSEEVAGVDLVQMMFHVAQGGHLKPEDPQLHGHSFEFRINAEDPGMGFMPAPGTLTSWQPPYGPGVRMDEGYHSGMTVPGAFDSLIGKLIITGDSREQAWLELLAPSTKSSSTACRRSFPFTGRWFTTRLSLPPTATSASLPTGSKPSSTTRSSHTPGPWASLPIPSLLVRSSSRSTVNELRCVSPPPCTALVRSPAPNLTGPPVAIAPGDAPRQPATRWLPDAGNDHQG
ncbi:biotin carboxylase of acetyl-CoA carboxylase [Cutibacterium acnes JCM 18918]|nr:biotin carboxylase of acetyl-CoA carboxylase [Cutibacterium acnes JCM 18918]